MLVEPSEPAASAEPAMMPVVVADHVADPVTVAPAAPILRRVLLVDDSRLQRRILGTQLRRWGFEVLEAGSAEEGLAICEDQPPDLIFSDWMMPGMSGLDFCRSIRRREFEHYIYFILLTSKSDKAEVATGLSNGADDFLCKPVNSDELRARITAAERILAVERELTDKNRMLSRALAETQELHQALEGDLAEARKLQGSLVPPGTTRFPGGDLSFLFQPSGHVGGDLVGYFPVTFSRIGLFALDVSGHGIASALITARLSNWLTGATPEQNVALRWVDGRIDMAPPEEICQRLNALFQAEIETEHYATILIADLDLATGRISACQAGHPHPMIQRADGGIEFPGHGGMPIGLLDDAIYEPFEAALAPGDRLFLYSDGITELPLEGDAMLDEEGLAGLFRKHRSAVGSTLIETLVWELSNLIDDVDFPDDLSGALFEYSGPPGKD